MGTGIFFYFFAPVTLTLTQRPSYMNMTHIPLIPDVQIWTSYITAFESHRL